MNLQFGLVRNCSVFLLLSLQRLVILVKDRVSGSEPEDKVLTYNRVSKTLIAVSDDNAINEHLQGSFE